MMRNNGFLYKFLLKLIPLLCFGNIFAEIYQQSLVKANILIYAIIPLDISYHENFIILSVWFIEE